MIDTIHTSYRTRYDNLLSYHTLLLVMDHWPHHSYDNETKGVRGFHRGGLEAFFAWARAGGERNVSGGRMLHNTNKTSIKNKIFPIGLALYLKSWTTVQSTELFEFVVFNIFFYFNSHPVHPNSVVAGYINNNSKKKKQTKQKVRQKKKRQKWKKRARRKQEETQRDQKGETCEKTKKRQQPDKVQKYKYRINKIK